MSDQIVRDEQGRYDHAPKPHKEWRPWVKTTARIIRYTPYFATTISRLYVKRLWTLAKTSYHWVNFDRKVAQAAYGGGKIIWMDTEGGNGIVVHDRIETDIKDNYHNRYANSARGKKGPDLTDAMAEEIDHLRSQLAEKE